MEYLWELLNIEDSYYQKLMKYNKFILFGASKPGEYAIKYLNSIGKKVIYICDNDHLKWGKNLSGAGIVPPDKLVSKDVEVPIIITSSFHKEIKEQLSNMGLKNVHYIYKLGYDNGFYDINTLKDNEEKINEVMDTLYDEKSKRILKELLKFRLTQDFSIFKNIYEKEQYYPENFIKIEKDTIFIDAGAYDGNTAIEFSEKSSNNYKKIYSFEPEESNFIKMKNNISKYELKNIELLQKGLSDENKIVTFLEGQEAGSKIDDYGDKRIETLALDSLELTGNLFIKMDIEVEELKALMGAKNTIISNKPQLAICIYHKSEDLWTIPLYIKSLVPDYKIYIRHHHKSPWETVCYAVL